MSAPSRLRCLFIKPKMIGDTLLLTPTLNAVRTRHPDAIIDVFVRSGCESILGGCLAHNEVFTTAPPHMDEARKTWGGTWASLRALRRQKYDWIFECSDTERGRYAALLARGRHRVLNRLELRQHGSRYNRGLWPIVFSYSVDCEIRAHHAVESNYRLARDFLQLPAQPPGLDFRPMTFDAAAANLRVPAGFTLARSRLVVHCGTRVAAKSWPDDRWMELVRTLAPHFDQIFVSTGSSASEVGLARQLAAIASEKIFCPDGALPWNQLAALLQGARLFIGVDTAAMHLAAACHCPSLVIWGPTAPIIWGPRAANAVIVLDNRIARPPFGLTEGYDDARLASRNATTTVTRAARELAGL
ncbi:MAG: lipopolysaccharide heptosyltransferase family protein [Opitutus sp.]|nr:lipopolysaccharide heptosyltransferase family protein [Opitutus sp.]